MYANLFFINPILKFRSFSIQYIYLNIPKPVKMIDLIFSCFIKIYLKFIGNLIARNH